MAASERDSGSKGLRVEHSGSRKFSWMATRIFSGTPKITGETRLLHQYSDTTRLIKRVYRQDAKAKGSFSLCPGILEAKVCSANARISQLPEARG